MVGKQQFPVTLELKINDTVHEIYVVYPLTYQIETGP